MVERRTNATQRQAARDRSPVIYLLPNLFTALALLAGFYAVLRTSQGDYITASWAIVFAACMDMLDGRVARMIDAQSEFGAHFDSLCDLVCFGLAPAVLAFEWGLDTMGRAGFAAGFFFCAATAVRLARFNVNLSDSDPNFFTGLPAPMAGVTVATTVLVFGSNETLGNSFLLLLLLVVLAMSMVSEVRYYSFKRLNLRARLSSPLMILAALLMISLAALVLLEFDAGGVLSVSLLYLAHGYWYTGRQLLADYRKFSEAGQGSLLKFLRLRMLALIERTEEEVEDSKLHKKG